MGYTAITAFLPEIEKLPERDLLTFVLPGGCNLNCSWCAVRARDERRISGAFKAESYNWFIERLAKADLINGVAIVGDEPLLPAAWPLAKRILETTENMSLPSAIITNGTWLSKRAGELDRLSPHIVVSLDGPRDLHDSTRRASGTFDSVLQGLEDIRKFNSSLDKVIISTVVQPEKFNELMPLANILHDLGIVKWTLSPLIQFRRNKSAQVHPRISDDIYVKMTKIVKLGASLGINVFIDDGLGLLRRHKRFGVSLENTSFVNPKTDKVRVIRMAPDGRTVRFDELSQLKPSSYYWDGLELPDKFVERLYYQ